MLDQCKILNPEGIYFLIFTIVDSVDIFTRFLHKEIIIDSLKYCQKNKGLRLFSFCLMTNHIHLIVSADGEPKLFEIIKDFKKFTNKSIIEEINNNTESRKKWLLNKFEFAGRYLQRIDHYKVWQDGYHAVELIKPDFTFQKIKLYSSKPD